jgi:hypothetical protein
MLRSLAAAEFDPAAIMLHYLRRCVTIDLRYNNGIPTILEASKKSDPNAQNGNALTQKKFKDFPLDSIFSLTAGDYHSLGEESAGPLPMVSCADADNGIIGGYTIPAKDTYENAITIAYNGSPLTTKIHPYKFAAKDDVAVAAPLKSYPVEALIFIVGSLNSERWRYSYYRKCFQAKLGRLLVKLPVTDTGQIDVPWMVDAVRAQPYWWFLAPRLEHWHATKPSELHTAP